MKKDDERALAIFVKYAEYHPAWFYNQAQWGREEVVFRLDRDDFWGRTKEQKEDLEFLIDYLKGEKK